MLWSFGPNVSMLCSLATGRELCRRGNARSEEESFHVLHHKYIIFLQSNLNWHHCSGNKPIISLPPFSYHQAFFKKKNNQNLFLLQFCSLPFRVFPCTVSQEQPCLPFPYALNCALGKKTWVTAAGCWTLTANVTCTIVCLRQLFRVSLADSLWGEEHD